MNVKYRSTHQRPYSLIWMLSVCKENFFSSLSHILFIVSSFSSEDNERIFINFFPRLYLRKEDEEKNIQRNRIILNVKARFGKVQPSFQPIQELVGQKVCAVLSTTKKKKKKNDVVENVQR